MAMIGRMIVIASGVAGGLVTSQAPEFAQQYRQRLGGALEEMKSVVADFEADASRNGLTREQALYSYRASANAFLRDRGTSMRKTLARYDSLVDQAARFDTWPAAAQPLLLIGESDAGLFAGTWSEYRPAVPVTIFGALWAAVGFGIGALFAHGGRTAGRSLTGPARRRGLPATRQGAAAPQHAYIGDAPAVAADPDGPVVAIRGERR